MFRNFQCPGPSSNMFIHNTDYVSISVAIKFYLWLLLCKSNGVVKIPRELSLEILFELSEVTIITIPRLLRKFKATQT